MWLLKVKRAPYKMQATLGYASVRAGQRDDAGWSMRTVPALPREGQEPPTSGGLWVPFSSVRPAQRRLLSRARPPVETTALCFRVRQNVRGVNPLEIQHSSSPKGLRAISPASVRVENTPFSQLPAHSLSPPFQVPLQSDFRLVWAGGPGIKGF